MVEDSPIEKEASAAEAQLPELPAPMSRMLCFVTVAMLSGLALCWCLRQKSAPPKTGMVTGRRTPAVSDWTGRIAQILVKTGDSVHAGDPIAILVNEQLLLQIDRQQREVDEILGLFQGMEESVDQELTHQLKAIDAEIVSLKTAAGLLADNDGLAESAAAARVRELETQRINAAHLVRERLGIFRIRDELVRAEAKLRDLESQSMEIILPAPVTGTIRRVLRRPNERVVEGTPLLELADQDQPYLVVEMPEPLAKRFALGDTIPLNFPGRQESIGRVANMLRLEDMGPALPEEASKKPNVRFEIEPINEDWPAIPLESPVRVRTSDSRAMQRRVH